MCSSWHRRTPSRSACARSKTTAEGHTTRWLGGRTLQSMSQRPHCRHCSMAPAGPTGSGQRWSQSAAAAGHPARARGAQDRGGASRGLPQVPRCAAARPLLFLLLLLGLLSGRRSRPRAAAGRATGSAPDLPASHTQVPAGPGPGSTQPVAAALPDPRRRAPHSALRAPRGRRRSCPARDKGPVGSLAPRVPGLGRPRRRRFVRPARSPHARRCDSMTPRLSGSGALGAQGARPRPGGAGAGPEHSSGTSPRPKHRPRPRPPTSCPATACESCGGRGLRRRPRSRRLSPRALGLWGALLHGGATSPLE